MTELLRSGNESFDQRAAAVRFKNPDYYLPQLLLTTGLDATPAVNNKQEYVLGNRELPIWQKMPEIISSLEDNPWLILVSETGSGKTTQVPQALWEAGYHERGPIYVVENRVAIAVEVAKRVAAEMGKPIGDEIGYLTGPEKHNSPDAKLIFMTSGVFRTIIRDNPTLSGISAVLFDEVDERYLQMDIAMALAHKAREQNKQTRIVIMSATLNAPKYATHFGNTPIVEAKGRPYPVDVQWADRPINRYRIPEEAARTVGSIIRSTVDGDVLVFMPGKKEIDDTIGYLEQQKVTGVSLLPFHSELSPEERALVFSRDMGRKIIVSTNIAERGITFEGVTHVVDSGMVKMNEYDPQADTTMLVTVPCAQDSIIQRKGRAGRTQPGTYYPLLTQKEYQDRPVSTKPELQRASLRDVVLQIKSMGYSREGDPLSFLDAPDKPNWQVAKQQLRLLGALDNNNPGNLSKKGLQLAELGCDPREGAMLLEAANLECVSEAAIIAAIRVSRPLLYSPKQEQSLARAAHALFRGKQSESDLLVLLGVYQEAEKNNFNGRWCKDHYVSWQSLQEIRNAADQFRNRMKRLGYMINKIPAENIKVRQAICAGFRDKVYKYTGAGWYTQPDGLSTIKIGRESVVSGEWIVANEIIGIVKHTEYQTFTKTFISSATVIDKRWLES